MEKAKVDFKKREVCLGGRTYRYEDLDDEGERVWFTNSTKFVRAEDGKKYLKSEEEWISQDPDQEIEPVEIKVKNPKRLKRLNEALDQALDEDFKLQKEEDTDNDRRASDVELTQTEPKAQFRVISLKKGYVKIFFKTHVFLGRPKEIGNYGRETDEYEFAEEIEDGFGKPDYIDVGGKMRKLLEKVSREHLGTRSEPSEPGLKARSGETEGSRKDKKKSSVKRTKYGTRILSNDGKHSFDIGVWKSRKYPGCTTIRLFVAGRHCLYTVDKIYMEALRSEILRGEPT